MKKVKVVLFGLGAMGSLIASHALKRRGLEVVGAVDIAKEKIGKDIGEVLALDEDTGVVVEDNVDALFRRVEADLAILSTVSYLKPAYKQISKCVSAGINVVSTCEELCYPYRKYPDLSSKIDKLAKKYDVTVLGTGINPGYLMDVLPIMLTAPCIEVHRVKVERVMYSGNRRNSYQKKIGTGLPIEVFKQMIDDNRITGHVGLYESICMIAASLGWNLDEIVELPPDPVVSDKESKTTYTNVKLGHAAGLQSVAYGVKEGEKVITLIFLSHANVNAPHDSVSIDGTPNIRQRIEGGIHGDLGTVAMVLNSIPKVIEARAGLQTMLDISIPSASGPF
jgi:4-hydroxy-tetrahydrodipicolinate reductase